MTGRNQPSNAKFILGPARWMRGLIRPPEGHGIAYVDFSSLYPQTVPASLHASLMARLDRLGPAREVAQVGTAIGREFLHALLATPLRRNEWR